MTLPRFRASLGPIQCKAVLHLLLAAMEARSDDNDLVPATPAGRYGLLSTAARLSILQAGIEFKVLLHTCQDRTW